MGNNGNLEPSALDGTDGFVINGTLAAGSSVSNAGDINGDGIDDLIIGAPSANGSGEPPFPPRPGGISSFAGESYVIFGGANVGEIGSLELFALDGTNGFVINGIDNYDSSGRVSNAGDINGDGIDDLIIGAPSADPNGQESAGESYVVFGGTDVGESGSLELSELDGTNGFVINGIDQDDRSGYSVSNAGDINGDGIDDLIIGAPSADPNGQESAGESYVVFGGANVGESGSLELSELDGTNGFVINGIDEYDGSGSSVSNAGDINGDGIDDLIISASGADPNGKNDAGESYVVFGGTDVGESGSLELSELDGTNGFVINGIDEDDRSGLSVSNAGDVNGDGIDDLILSGTGESNALFGGGEESYVIFGFKTIEEITGTANNDVLSGTTEGETISGLTGNDSIKGLAGDDNILGGDGKDTLRGNNGNDVIRGGDGNDDIWGQADNDSIDGGKGTDRILGNNGEDTLNGGDDIDTLFGGNGNDSIFGDAGDDQVVGNAGNDTLFGGADNDILFAGTGEDQLFGEEGDDVLWGQADNDFVDGGAGTDVLYGNNGNDVLVGGDGTDSLFGNQGNDTLKGGADNDILFGNDGNDSLYSGEGNDTLWGGSGNDTLLGGTGNDIYFFDADSQLGTDIIAENRIALKTFHNRYLRAGNPNEPFGDTDWSINQVGYIDTWETFDVIPTDNGKVAFRTFHDRYIRAGGSSENYRLNQETVIGTNEQFDVIDRGNGQFAFKTFFNKYFRAGNPNEPFGDTDWFINQVDYIDTWETFTPISQNSDLDTLNFSQTTTQSINIDLSLHTQQTINSNLSLILDSALGIDIEKVVGGSLHDRLTGNNLNNILIGGAGKDTLIGGAGNDRLVGNNGNDSLYGGEGNDTLWSGSGNDVFELTRGADVGVDRIKDYQDGLDKFLLSDRFGLGSLEFSDLTITQKGNTAQIRITENSQLLAIVDNTNVAQLDNSDFILG